MPLNSRRLRQVLAKAAHARKMSEILGIAVNAAAFSAPPGLEAPPGLTQPDVCTPPPGLAPAPGLVCCKAEGCFKNSSSGTVTYLESCSTSTSCCSSTDDEETESEAEGSQMKANLPCFVRGFCCTLKMQLAEEFRMKADVSCSVPRFLTTILHPETTCRKHTSSLATTLLGFPLPR